MRVVFSDICGTGTVDSELCDDEAEYVSAFIRDNFSDMTSASGNAVENLR
ncbi:MAG: hypothetical protein J1F64_10415 [Oscillospiraceae bacterium]|nr:hypothetical protein [Oscillospiraceae bacterium]